MANGLNLLDTIKGYLTPDVMQRISSLAGESPGNTQRAMGSIVPTLLSGAAKLAESPGGDNQLMSLINDQTSDGNVLNSLASKLGGGGATDSFMGSGRDIAKGLFGNKTDSVIAMLGRSLGIKSGVISSLLSIAAPIVMGVLAKEKNARGLGAAGLASLLAGQKSMFSQFLPAGLASLMGWTDNGRTEQRLSETPRHEAPRAVHEATRERRSDWWLLPALGVAALALLVYSFWPRGSVVSEQPVAQQEVRPAPATAENVRPTQESRAIVKEAEPVPQEPAVARPGSVVSASNEGSVASGSRAARVERAASGAGVPATQDLRQIQQTLKDQGQYTGPIDGIMGPRTREAVRQFQKANGLRPTGTLDETTMKRLMDIR